MSWHHDAFAGDSPQGRVSLCSSFHRGGYRSSGHRDVRTTVHTGPRMLERLFVYGTLKRESSLPLAQELNRCATFEGEARFNGRLYLVSLYPAAIPSDRPEEWVYGELYVVRDPGFLVTLDRYEECGPEDIQPTEFRRVAQTIVNS